MAIATVLATGITIGAINTDASTTVDHNFGKSSIWSHPALLKVDVTSDEGGAALRVSGFVDGTGPKSGKNFVGLFSPDATKVTFKLSVLDCLARGVCITEFFD